MIRARVIPIKAYRELKRAEAEDYEYQARILAMDKLELLEEMVRFQEERSRLDRLTLPLMIRGRILFKALSESAETQELRHLTRTYKRHLELELESYLKKSVI